MTTKTYKGYAYRQSQDPSAPWIINFVATAEDIRTWAGVPRRAEGTEFGFQRITNDKRVIRAMDYFRLSGNNQSPTSIIIGVHPSHNIVSPRARLNFLDSDETSIARSCELHVDVDDELPLEDVVVAVQLQIENRLASVSDPLNDEDAFDEDDEEDSDNKDDDDEYDDFGSDDQNGEIEIGKSLMTRFLESLGDPQWCKKNEEAIREIAKPATVIDGQHRLLGAAACEREIPFSVCALFNCPWEEQVFQFTVVNYTSSKVPDQFVTANAALSLTRPELGRLEDRLIQAGVKVVEYELMKIVNFDDRSPFHNLINLTEKADSSKIGYKTMVSVAKEWYSGRSDATKVLLRRLYPNIKKQQDRIEKWKDEDWGDFFLTFWRQVQTRYQGIIDFNGTTLMSVGSNLMIAIVLLEVQKAYLTNLNAQDDEYFEPSNGEDPKSFLLSQVEKRAEKVLQYLPPDFFAIKWGTKSLNNSAGRKALKSALRTLIDSKGKSAYKNLKLVTGDYGDN